MTIMKILRNNNKLINTLKIHLKDLKLILLKIIMNKYNNF